MCGKGLHDMNKQDPPMWGPRGKIRCRECVQIAMRKYDVRRREARKLQREQLAAMQTAEITGEPVRFQPVRWENDAACQEYPPELFFDDGMIEEAKAACAGCLVRAECLAYALAIEENQQDIFGVWGGMAASERERMRAGQLTRADLVLVS